MVATPQRAIVTAQEQLEKPRRGGEMKNKQKYNQKSKIELPKRYKKNKK